MQHAPDRTSPQSPAMSMLEASTNVAVGFIAALATQAVLFPHLGLAITLSDNILISTVFTAVSLLRSYMLRRLFETIRTRNRPGA